MQRYLLRRILLMIPVFGLVALATFSMVRFLPGDIVTIMAEEFQYAETVERMRDELGLNDPFVVQFGRWVGDIVRGDLGDSMWTKRPVWEDVKWRWPVTVELTIISLIMQMTIAIPIGIIAAIRQDTILDYVTRTLAILGIAVPTFWTGTLVVTLPSVWWGWTPPLEYKSLTDDLWGNIGIMLIPSAILAVFLGGRVVRMLRATMLEVLRQDYIRTAWAKGLKERSVIYRHAAKNALIPVVSLIGLEIPTLLSGTVVIERIFDLPGMGRYMLDLLEQRDYVPTQSVVLLFALMVMVTNLLVDLSYAVLDPRIRYS
ncbi:MAG: ABC transporter permease [Chloroflexi bacterium]|nr:ABC transporter permease [Chloroflexota bacterium]